MFVTESNGKLYKIRIHFNRKYFLYLFITLHHKRHAFKWILFFSAQCQPLTTSMQNLNYYSPEIYYSLPSLESWCTDQNDGVPWCWSCIKWPMGWLFSFERNYLCHDGRDHGISTQPANQGFPNQSQISPFFQFSSWQTWFGWHWVHVANYGI